MKGDYSGSAAACVQMSADISGTLVYTGYAGELPCVGGEEFEAELLAGIAAGGVFVAVVPISSPAMWSGQP